jgi:hypothetical protein
MASDSAPDQRSTLSTFPVSTFRRLRRTDCFRREKSARRMDSLSRHVQFREETACTGKIIKVTFSSDCYC